MKKETENKKKSKKIIFIIIGIVLFLAVLAFLIWFLFMGVVYSLYKFLEYKEDFIKKYTKK